MINEVFPNPTVKQVVFQIRFPNLFFLESRLGDYQAAIMARFPESRIAYRRLVFGDIGPDVKPEDLPKLEKSGTIWQFMNSSNQVTLSLTTGSLDIASTSHKSYSQGTTDTFRELIQFATEPFLKLVSIPSLTRVGLRYVDECPLPNKNVETLKSYYNSVFPTDRFSVESAVTMAFRIVLDKKDHYISYVESLQEVDSSYKLILDFDGYANNVKASDLMLVLDKLHESVSQEFQNTIKEPVYEFMRQAGKKDG